MACAEPWPAKASAPERSHALGVVGRPCNGGQVAGCVDSLYDTPLSGNLMLQNTRTSMLSFFREPYSEVRTASARVQTDLWAGKRACSTTVGTAGAIYSRRSSAPLSMDPQQYKAEALLYHPKERTRKTDSPNRA